MIPQMLGTRLYVITGSLLFYCSLNLGAAYSSLPLVQNLSNPVIIILIKLTCCSGLALISNWWQVSCSAAEAAEDSKSSHELGVAEKTGGLEEDMVPAGYVLSFRKAFIRLSFTMYLVSNYVIRLDFFSSRLLYSVFFYDTVGTKS